MTKKQKFILFRIIISAALFVAMMIWAALGKMNPVLLLVPYLIIGYDVLLGAVQNLFKGKMLDEKFLMSIATVGALILGEYPEALAVMLFYQVGELFLHVAVDKSRESVAKLMDICPEHAIVLRDGAEVRVEPYEVKLEEIIIVRAGERIPLDGVIVEGGASLDTVALTGESLPREVTVGDNAVSGSVSLNGVIKLRVTSLYEDSTVAKILELVESASERKAKAENFITKFAKIYTPIVVALALALAVIPPLFLGEWLEWVQRALIFLVVSCPCALVISVPLTFFGGIGAMARQGILVKGSNYIEQLAKAKTVVFDKTGTLTYGSFEVIKIVPNGIDESGLLKLAATAESFSNHPIARSVCERYDGRLEGVIEAKEYPGMGVVAGEIACGNIALMKELGIDTEDPEEAGSIIHVAESGKYMGYLVIADKVKESSYEAVELLEEMAVDRIVMLTGDNTAAAENVGAEVGISERYSHLLPGEKVAKLEGLISEKGRNESVCYVGDGINDAPVLAIADVGIAMGVMGSDAAIEAADVVLMDDDPIKVALAVDISKFTLSIAKQNIILALGVKLVVLILGALGIAGMWAAVFADVGVAVLATLNAMRTLKQ